MALSAVGVKDFSAGDTARQLKPTEGKPGQETVRRSFAYEVDVNVDVLAVAVHVSALHSATLTIPALNGTGRLWQTAPVKFANSWRRLGSVKVLVGIETMAGYTARPARIARRRLLRAASIAGLVVASGGAMSACFGDSSRDEDGYYKFARTRPRGTYEYDPQERERLRQEYQPSGGS